MLAVDLKKLCRGLGLAQSGTKADNIKSILNAKPEVKATDLYKKAVLKHQTGSLSSVDILADVLAPWTRWLTFVPMLPSPVSASRHLSHSSARQTTSRPLLLATVIVSTSFPAPGINLLLSPYSRGRVCSFLTTRRPSSIFPTPRHRAR
jgi:hypothetical protein